MSSETFVNCAAWSRRYTLSNLKIRSLCTTAKEKNYSLPLELWSQILTQLTSLTDLLAFRTSCKSNCALVQDCAVQLRYLCLKRYLFSHDCVHLHILVYVIQQCKGDGVQLLQWIAKYDNEIARQQLLHNQRNMMLSSLSRTALLERGLLHTKLLTDADLYIARHNNRSGKCGLSVLASKGKHWFTFVYKKLLRNSRVSEQQLHATLHCILRECLYTGKVEVTDLLMLVDEFHINVFKTYVICCKQHTAHCLLHYALLYDCNSCTDSLYRQSMAIIDHLLLTAKPHRVLPAALNCIIQYSSYTVFDKRIFITLRELLVKRLDCVESYVIRHCPFAPDKNSADKSDVEAFLAYSVVEKVVTAAFHALITRYESLSTFIHHKKIPLLSKIMRTFGIDITVGKHSNQIDYFLSDVKLIYSEFGYTDIPTHVIVRMASAVLKSCTLFLRSFDVKHYDAKVAQLCYALCLLSKESNTTVSVIIDRVPSEVISAALQLSPISSALNNIRK